MTVKRVYLCERVWRRKNGSVATSLGRGHPGIRQVGLGGATLKSVMGWNGVLLKGTQHKYLFQFHLLTWFYVGDRECVDM